MGFETLVLQSDALKGLLAREEGAEALARKYTGLTARPGTRSASSNVCGDTREILYPGFLEIIIGHPEVCGELTENPKAKVQNAAASHIEGESYPISSAHRALLPARSPAAGR